MTRKEAREIMMQILYEMDASGELEPDRAVLLAEQKLPGNHKERGSRLLVRIIEDIENIDDMINRASSHWKTSRMPKVDLAIMRLACGEMCFDDDIPDAIAVNEAIDIGKKYSTERSARFIHGVLGAVSQERNKK